MTGQELREFRKAHGWSQDKLGQLLYASLGKYRKGASKWETGGRAVPDDVAAFLLSLETEPVTVFDGDRELSFEPVADTPPPPPSAEQAAGTLAAVVGGGSYARVCEELWELVATGVGMIGAVTGSDKLRRDGEIIAHDKAALGKAYGKLAEQNQTFRTMLAGMTGGGAWLEVALVSGITAGKLMRNHQRPAPVEEPPESEEFQHVDGAVVNFPG